MYVLNRAVEVSDYSRQYELAKKAFLKSSRLQANPMLCLDALAKVPVFVQESQVNPTHAFYLASMLDTLVPYIREHGVRSVLEIGPERCLLAVLLHKLYGCRFVFVDLPEMLNLGYTVLSYHLPNSQIVLPNEIDSVGETVWQSDFVML